MADERRNVERGNDRGRRVPASGNDSRIQRREFRAPQSSRRSRLSSEVLMHPFEVAIRRTEMGRLYRGERNPADLSPPRDPRPRPLQTSSRGTGRPRAMDRGATTQQLVPVASNDRRWRLIPITFSPVMTDDSAGVDNSNSGASPASAMLAIRDRPINPDLLVTRPNNCTSKKGTGGRTIQLQANYFKIIASNDWRLYKYHVYFEPEVERTVTRKGLIRMHRESLGQYIYDGSIMYMSHPLDQTVMTLYSKLKSDNTKIKITIRFVGDMEKGDEHYLQFYNIIMRKSLEFLQLQLVGRNFYDARSKVEVPQYKLELWPGYITSIRQHENDILMCAEISYKVMRQQTVLDILHDCYQQGAHDYQARFRSQVIGLTILTVYNNFTYRIEDVDFTASPSSTFSSKNGEITYKDYYLNRYQINIRDAKQPMLVSRSKARDRRAGLQELVYLVPELARTTGLSDDMRNDFRLMQELAKHTRINPTARIEKLRNFNLRLQGEPKVVGEFKNWDLKLDERLVDINARQFPPEAIHFHNSEVSAGHQANWTSAVRQNQMATTAKLQDWFVICPGNLIGDAQRFVGKLREAVRDMKFEVSSPKFHPLESDHPTSYQVAIEEIMRRYNPQMLMCVVRNNRGDRYAAIKKKCCIDRPVPTQCIISKTLNGNLSVATKIAVQMNCKIGGVPWRVSVKNEPLMVVGFDVCRDSANKNISYGATVASLDISFGRYFSAINAHTTSEELAMHLVGNMSKALGQYRSVNKVFPKRIVVYRDGVGDGQLHFVLKHELENLKKMLTDVYRGEDQVKLTYVIVTKRLNTRLFMNGQNPPPGTVVDDVITIPIKYDFYIVAQSVRQGSVAPTGYNVVYDTSGYPPWKIQLLSYQLTHMYFNWSGTVRVPAPCQLARKLAFLVSQSLHAQPSSHLQTILYYL